MAKKIILAVDDSNTVLASVKGMLSDIYEVRTATDAKSAEESVKSGTPDLMLLDIEMPGASGIQLLNKMNKSGDATFPIIFLSSNSDAKNVVKTAKLGATGFIEKPSIKIIPLQPRF